MKDLNKYYNSLYLNILIIKIYIQVTFVHNTAVSLKKIFK